MNFNDKNAVLIPLLKEGDKVKIDVIIREQVRQTNTFFLEKDNKGLYFKNVGKVYLKDLSAKITKIS